MLAGRTLAMNDRIQILSRPTLRGRLVTFFSQYVRRAGKCFAIPFDRADMAAYLGTDRSALSRELSRMQREGLLRFRKNRFEILRTMDEE
jgi:CRP-like cAMP-binding protein